MISKDPGHTLLNIKYHVIYFESFLLWDQLSVTCSFLGPWQNRIGNYPKKNRWITPYVWQIRIQIGSVEISNYVRKKIWNIGIELNLETNNYKMIKEPLLELKNWLLNEQISHVLCFYCFTSGHLLPLHLSYTYSVLHYASNKWLLQPLCKYIIWNICFKICRKVNCKDECDSLLPLLPSLWLAHLGVFTKIWNFTPAQGEITRQFSEYCQSPNLTLY